ncbi:FliH/SctL family protein [Caballeronia sp. dw_19]|uniref:FliH/SctL family protein n=1 Tax=Caballeronia sp. dw_19 TaxID=2719791 RepID=UPI001BCBF424|nr:FliH/SctL family protein [Caballeronia sp. dw_19]
MKQYRRYVFPSLAHRLGTHDPADTAAAVLPLFDSAPSEAALQIAREEGFREGQAAGYAESKEAVRLEAKRALDALTEPLDAMISGFDSLQEAYRSEMRDEIAGLVEKVARQVIRNELVHRPELLLEFVSEALAEMPKVPAVPANVEVRLNPGEYQRILAVAPERAAVWRLAPDARLEPGECRVKAGDREMDAGCSQRLALCIERISAHLQSSAPPRDITPHPTGEAVDNA